MHIKSDTCKKVMSDLTFRSCSFPVPHHPCTFQYPSRFNRDHNAETSTRLISIVLLLRAHLPAAGRRERRRAGVQRAATHAGHAGGRQRPAGRRARQGNTADRSASYECSRMFRANSVLDAGFVMKIFKIFAGWNDFLSEVAISSH